MKVLIPRFAKMLKKEWKGQRKQPKTRLKSFSVTFKMKRNVNVSPTKK